MICPIDNAGYCSRHQRKHIGHAAILAITDTQEAERYRQVWDRRGVSVASSKPILRSLPLAKQCMYMGERLTPEEVKEKQLVGCRTCNNVVPAFHCKYPGMRMFNDGPYTRQTECMGCDKWKGPVVESNEMPRHLLFHLWPKKTSLGTWQRNLDQLKQRWSLFTGKRVIAVATSADSHDLESVQSYMQGYDCEWIHVENDSKLREVKTFLPLFERVEGLPGYTFYGQGKGVTKPINPGVSIHRWTAAMFETLLDYWPLVEDLLKRHPVAGSFKKGIAGFTGSRSTWHYSGSFCWFNNAQLFSRNWRDIEQVWFGIESYPSMLFTVQEAGTVFFERHGKFNLYNMRQLNSILQELDQWRQEKAAYRTNIGLSTTTGQS